MNGLTGGVGGPILPIVLHFRIVCVCVCVCVSLQSHQADPGGHWTYGVGLQSLAYWDCGFETRQGHRCLSLVNIVCCAGRGLYDGLISRPEASYRLRVSLSLSKCTVNPLYLQ